MAAPGDQSVREGAAVSVAPRVAGRVHRGCHESRESCSERREAVPTLRSLHHPAWPVPSGLTALARSLIETRSGSSI